MIHSRFRRAGFLAASFLTIALSAHGAKTVWAQETPKTATPPTVPVAAPPAVVLPPATPEQLKEGKSLLDAAIKAHGGEAFLKLKTLTAKGKGLLTPPGGQIPPIPIDSAKIYAGENGQSRLEMETGYGPVILASAGPGKGWLSAAGNVQDQAEASGIGDPTSILRAAVLEKNVTVRSLPTGEKMQTAPDGKKLKAILVTNDKGRAVTLYLDAETNLLRRIDNKSGTTSTSVILDEYKAPVEGVMLPGKLSTLVNSQEAFSLTLSDFVLNKTLDAKMFEKPKE